MNKGLAVILGFCAGFMVGWPFAGSQGVDVMKKARIARSIPKPLPGHPGNVFVMGEEVAVKPPEAPGAAGWVCLDYDRKTLSKGTGPAVLGKLPVGYYEVWATDATGKQLRKTTLGVLEPLRAPTPEDSPICLDVSAAWFNNRRYGLPPNIQDAATEAALAGVNWVRDRLTWAQTEPERSRFADKTVYDETARIQSETGLKVLQVFHSSPKWANPMAPVRFPLDLCDVYNYLKTMSARWRGQVRAWEPWNEADITAFGGHAGAEIAAYQKAAYWGIRQGNPDAIICQNVFAGGGTEVIRANFDENEPWAYFDTFNFHHYIHVDSLPAYYSSMRQVSGGRPLWVSEAAMPVRWEGDEKEQEPTWESQRRQAGAVPKVFAASIHEGVSALFYFMLPHYVEGRTQYGLTRKDLTPRPGYLALAAAGRLLAGAKPLGRLKTPGSSSPLRAFVFRAVPDGEEKVVVVAWAQEGKAVLPIPADVKPVRAIDLLGRAVDVPVMPVEVSESPVYLLYACGAEKRFGLVPPPAPAAWKEAVPCPVVIQALLPPDCVRLGSSSYELSKDEEMDISLYVYNFGDQTIHTRVVATGEERLRVVPDGTPVALEPMGRKEIHFRASWVKSMPSIEAARVRFSADCGAQRHTVTVIRLTCPRFDVPPLKSLPLESAKAAANWRRLVSPGKMTIEPAEGGGALIDAVMQPGDRWAYPILKPPPGELPNGDWDGIAFTIVPLAGQGDFKAIFDKVNGSSYFASADLGFGLKIGKPCRTVVMFRECGWGGFSKPDPDQQLVPDQIRALKLGCNTKEEHIRFVIRDVMWVKYKR